MNGPGHYEAAEELLEQASSVLPADVAPDERAELLARQGVAASMATAHALLALAAATGLSAHLDAIDTQAWRDAAATAITTTRPAPGPRVPAPPLRDPRRDGGED